MEEGVCRVADGERCYTPPAPFEEVVGRIKCVPTQLVEPPRYFYSFSPLLPAPSCHLSFKILGSTFPSNLTHFVYKKVCEERNS